MNKLLLAAGLVLAVAAPLRAQSPEGTYVGELMGVPFEVILEPGGRAVIEGEAARWRLEGEQLLIVGPEGEALVGRLSGNQLTLHLEDGDILEMRRTGGGAEGQITGPAPDSPVGSATGRSPPRPAGKAPKPRLPGKRVRPEGQTATLVIPKGWSHRWGNGRAGESAYVVTPPGGEAKGLIAITLMPLSAADAGRPMPELLEAGATELLQGAPASVVEGPTEFRLGGRRAGQVILHVQVPKADGSVAALEGNLAGVLVDEFAYVFLGLYEAKNAALLRAGMDTMLASFSAPKLKENLALKQRLAGCWTRYEGDTSGGSSHSDEATYRFGPDGSYAYSGASTVSGGFGNAISQSQEQGRFKVVGSTLHLFPQGQPPTSASVRLEGGRLQVGRLRFLPCR